MVTETTKPNISEHQLVRLLKDHETIGLEYLYDHYAQTLLGIIVKIVQSSTVAEEVLQDVFIRIWHRIEDYDPSRSKLFTWMMRISRNLAIDKIRSKEMKNGSKTDLIEHHNKDLEVVSAFELHVDNIGLRNQLQVLPEHQVEIIELIYYQGYTHVEISEEFGIPLGTVKTRARSALKRLRKFIPQEY